MIELSQVIYVKKKSHEVVTSPYLMYNIASQITNISWQTDINEQYLHSEHDPSMGNKLALYCTAMSDYSHGETFLNCSVRENSQS